MKYKPLIFIPFCTLVALSDKEDSSCGCSSGLDRSGYQRSTSSSDEDQKERLIQETQHESTLLTPNYVSNMVYVNGGSFYMGTDKPVIPYDGESPRRRVTVKSFYIDKYEVCYR